MPDKDNMPWGIAKTGWAKYATHMSMVGGLFLGPIGENSNFTKMFKLLVPEEEALLGLHVKNKPTSVEEVAKSANIPVSNLSEGKYTATVKAIRDGKTVAKVSDPNVSAVEAISGILAGKLPPDYDARDLREERLEKYAADD